MFNESVENNDRISYDDWYTERRLATDAIYLVDIGSVEPVKSPNYLIAAHQKAARLNAPDKIINISRFDNLNVKKHFVEIDEYRYPRAIVLTNFPGKYYTDQYRDFKLFYREFVGEELLTPYISYPVMKNKHSIQVIDLRFQLDHITPKKIQFFEE